MGLADRDYMRERREPHFGSRRSAQTHFAPDKNFALRSTLWMVLAWVAALFLLYQGFLWWQSQERARQNARPAASSQETSRSTPTPRPPEGERLRQKAPVVQKPLNADERTVTKCVLNGQVSFSDQACPKGASTSTVTVNTANVGTVQPPKFVPVTQASPPQIVFQQSTVTYSNAPSTEQECQFLKAEIERIDARARQPQSGQTQDELSARKKKLRSRQFALRC